MGNCLKTQLKEACSGELVHMDGIKVVYVSEAASPLGVFWDNVDKGSVKSLNNNSVDETDIATFITANYTIPNGTVFEFRNKTKIVQLAFFGGSFNFNELQYSTKLRYITARGAGHTGDLSIIFASTLSIDDMEVDIKDSLITGNLDILATTLAPQKVANAKLLLKNANGIVTFMDNGVETIIPKNTNKTVTFDGQGGYTIA